MNPAPPPVPSPDTDTGRRVPRIVRPNFRFDSDSDWDFRFDRDGRFLPDNDHARELQRLHELQALMNTGAISRDEALRQVPVDEFPAPSSAQNSSSIREALVQRFLRGPIGNIRPPRPAPEPFASTCSLEKGCSGFCATCKRCTLHCTCTKASDPNPPRRIRL